MKIHTTKKGEKLCDISKDYEISEEIIRQTNHLKNGEPATGEELLLQKPTRSYTVVYGDTVDRISIRFGIRKNDLYALNPWIIGTELQPGQILTLKTEGRKNGMSVANGYFYKGCSREKLTQTLPFLTYVTFAAAKADSRGVHKAFDCQKEIEICTENSKIPLVRVHDDYKERYKSENSLTEFAEELIALATEGGFKGIVLDACSFADSANEFSSFLIFLRKMMIGCDLILITEINENSPMEFSEYADGSVLYYPKYAMESEISFEEGEKKTISDFACKGESTKAFIDLPSLATNGKSFLSIDEALVLARGRGYEIETKKDTLLSRFTSRKQGEYRYSSLSGIHAILELMNEFDYMGICFDIMRTPLSHLMMYNAMFKTSYCTNVRSREGCSRGVEE